jgi:GDP-L-fucose synthase
MSILVTGATGFLGKRVCKKLQERELSYIPTSKSLGLDLRNTEKTLSFFKEHKPKYILNCAAYVGGIQFGYKHFADIFENNLLMTVNLLKASRIHKVTRLVNPISNCAYPAEATLFKEDEFWNGPLHESVMVYGFVRKASWIGSWAYHHQHGLDVINIILSNMYGPEDHFDEERSHALGALIRKFVDAKDQSKKNVTIWGTGSPVREWLFVDDGAEAMIRSLDINSHNEPINIGVGEGISITDMANKIQNFVDYKGNLVYDITKPDGAPYKTVDGSKGRKIFGWKPSMEFDKGVQETINWYVANKHKFM